MIAIYKVSTGQLICSVATMIDVAKVLPVDTAVKDVGVILDGHVWDASTLAFVAPKNPSVISKDDLLRRFTETELKAFFLAEKSDLGEGQKDLILAFRRHMEQRTMIDLQEPAVRSGIRYLEHCKILGVGRSEQILT